MKLLYVYVVQHLKIIQEYAFIKNKKNKKIMKLIRFSII